MKRMLMAGALALAAGSVGGQAFAADLPPPPAPPPRAPATYVPIVAPVFSWTGIYIGINGGYAFGSSDWTGGVVPSGSFSTNGFLAGGTLGVNYQTGAFVFGVEGDGDWTDIRGKGPATFCVNCQTANDWLSTARGRAGFAWDRLLFYGTGGAAIGNVQASANGVTNSNTEIGWTAGAGIEAAFAPNWTAKVEYLYVDLANGSCTTACGAPPFAVQSVRFTQSLVRAGINYKFGW